MAYQIQWQMTIQWVGDGSGQMSVPGAQVLTVNNLFGANGGQVQVPGGDAPSTGNITTAANTAATNAATALNAQIGKIQGFATGNQ